eukprot:scaffold9941_cov116-Isochrysis_galbana.AAC.9
MLRVPRIIAHGGGSISRVPAILAELGARRPLIVTDGFLASPQSGALSALAAPLDAAGISYSVTADTIPDPTSDSVDAVVEAMRAFKPDALIALGGGSPMDTAKAAGLIHSFGGHPRDYKAPRQTHAPTGTPLVAIPTTAGTGSEVTQFTIVIDSSTGEKMLLAGAALLPTAAVVDYELTLSMPLRLTADTGIDALCHAMEAYVSKKANAMTDPTCLSALSRIGTHLRAVCEEPDDRPRREGMMLAATEAGIAFSNSSVTLIHGMSRPLGARYHIPHGMSNAQLAPEVTAFSLGGAPGRYAAVCRALGMCQPGLSDEDAASALPDGLRALCRDLAVPTLQQCSVTRASLDAVAGSMAREALASGSPNNNPIVPTAEEIQALYQTIFRQGEASAAAA